MKRVYIYISLLCVVFTKLFAESNPPEYFHIFNWVNPFTSVMMLKDGSIWQIGYWYRSTVKKWESRDRLKIYLHSEYGINYNFIEVENLERQETVWAFPILMRKSPHNKQTIKEFSKGIDSQEISIILNTGYVFSTSNQKSI